MLLRVIPVRAEAWVGVAPLEALGQRAGGRGRVGLRGVVDLGCFFRLAFRFFSP